MSRRPRSDRRRLLRVFRLLGLTLALLSPSAASLCAQDEWKPAEGPLFTRWTAEVSPETVWPEYPRPQLVRDRWVNLNGLWSYAIQPFHAAEPEEWSGKILVPFAIESALSGVMSKVGPGNRLWYRRTFEAPELAEGERLLLHFEAVDWHAEVAVNGSRVGEHRGGFAPFSFDITDALRDAGEQEVVVSVWDPTDAGFQPRGKQVQEPEGIWYTSVTGIWQTVWLEPVPRSRIRDLRILPSFDAKTVQITADTWADAGPVELIVEFTDGALAGRAVGAARAQKVAGPLTAGVLAKVPDAEAWSPDSPTLYAFDVVLRVGGEEADRVSSYFGLRDVRVEKADDGHPRLFLNGEPVFHYGPLDQGWWPDGLLTPPTDAAMRYDLEITKKLGFNTVRKHVKVEPRRWYRHADELGLLVWQDMPNGDRHIGPGADDIRRVAQSSANYRRELKEMIDTHFNPPSIVCWVPFNEGWGQFDTDEVLAWTKGYDPSRIVDGPSGWTDRGTGEMHDVHRYPGPGMPDPEERRAVVLGEFGGLGLPLEGHLWWNKRNWGYRTYETREQLHGNYERLLRKLHPLVGRGLAAAIYTQTTDVEGEVNGLMTYDREVVKFDTEQLLALHAPLYEWPQPRIEVVEVVPSSRDEGRSWRYTTKDPGEDWASVRFDDSRWKRGEGGFGERSTPGTRVRTEWTTDDIWIRRDVEIEDAAAIENLHLSIHHDEDAEVYLNGDLVARLSGYTTDYEEIPIPDVTLRDGKNVLAVRCHQTQGGQYIDVGLVDLRRSEP